MTAMGAGGGSPGVLPNLAGGGTGSGTVPTLPDGTPNFPAAGGAGSADPTVSIWNLPSELDGRRIWFDIGHNKAVIDQNVGAAHSPDIKPGGTRHVVNAGSYQILKSPDQVMKQFAAMSYNDPNGFIALQKALGSGPWGKVYATGAFDSATEKALGDAMLQYVKLSQGAGVGVSFVDYLIQTGERAQQLGGQGTSVGGGSQQTINLTDPAQIRMAAQNAAQQALGQGLSSKQLEKFVAQFQAQQIQNQTDAYTTSTKLPAEAMAFAQQADPQAYQNNKRQAYVDTLVNMFAPSGSQRPDMTPVPTV